MNNFERMAEMLRASQRKAVQDNTGICAELGTVNGDRSLTVDSIKASIPRGDYLTALPMAAGNATTPAGDPSHNHTVPGLRGIQPGDRVLVIWAGCDPVVTAIVAGS